MEVLGVDDGSVRTCHEAAAGVTSLKVRGKTVRRAIDSAIKIQCP